MRRIFKSNLFFLIILASLVFIVYGKSINYEFTGLDDDALTSEKSLYISDVKNFPDFFLTDCYHNKKITQYYRPILSLTFAIETILFGVNTKIYHLTNIIIFILALYLMYLFLCNFCSSNKILKCIILLCAVHPIFASSIVWIPARNDTLLSVFIFLFLINYINYIKVGKNISFIMSCVFFVFALFTKETAIVVFPMLISLIYCFDFKISKKQILAYIFILVPVLLIYFYLRHIAVASINLNHYIKFANEYLSSMFYGIMLYVKYLFLVYNIPIMMYELQFDVLSLIINIVLFLIVIFLCFFNFINKKIIIFSCLWFVLFLIPSFAQEYYAWLPHRLIISILPFILILCEILKKVFLFFPFLKKYSFYIFSFLLIFFSFCSFLQSDQYKNSENFWVNSYRCAPNYFLACNGLIDVFLEQKEYQKAYFLLKTINVNKSIELSYRIKEVTLDFILYKNINETEKRYLELLKETTSYYDIANIFARLSDIYYLKKDLNKAIEYAEKSLELQPYDKHTLVYLANYYALNKQFSKARPIYERLLKDDNNNEYYHYLIKTLDEDERENKTN